MSLQRNIAAEYDFFNGLLAQHSQSAGILTLAIHPADVERGMVLGVESLEGKPRFVVNLTAAKSSGISFEARFLNLCRIVEQ